MKATLKCCCHVKNKIYKKKQKTKEGKKDLSKNFHQSYERKTSCFSCLLFLLFSSLCSGEQHELFMRGYLFLFE